MHLLKKQIQRLLGCFGYVLVKKATVEASKAPLKTDHWGGKTRRAAVFGLRGDQHFADPEFARYRETLPLLSGQLSLPDCYELFAACRELAGANILGDVVDCGDGSVETLAVVASAFASLGDTNRRLKLLDVSVDPTHLGESELDVWGADRNLLELQSDLATPGLPLPAELTSIAYPAHRISVLRYPRDSYEFLDPLAFLILTTESYIANRRWIARLLPLVAIGGVVAVRTAEAGPSTQDAVEQALRDLNMALSFTRFTANYRIAT